MLKQAMLDLSAKTATERNGAFMEGEELKNLEDLESEGLKPLFSKIAKMLLRDPLAKALTGIPGLPEL